MVPVAGVAGGGEGVLGKGAEGRHRVSTNPRAALFFSFIAFIIILFVRKTLDKAKKKKIIYENKKTPGSQLRCCILDVYL